MGFASYFLIVWDFIKYARDNGIPVGRAAARRSARSSSYCSAHHRPRPDRVQPVFRAVPQSRPHLDARHRHRLLRRTARRSHRSTYRKYGKERVAQIVTFGTMAARAAIRDAGRALASRCPDVDRIAKLMPSGPGGLVHSAGARADRRVEALYDDATQIPSCSTPPSDRRARAQRGDERRRRRHLVGPLMDYTPLVHSATSDSTCNTT